MSISIKDLSCIPGVFMDSNTLTLAAAFLWAIVWIVLPDKVLKKRPTLRKIFFATGILLGIAAFLLLITQHG